MKKQFLALIFAACCILAFFAAPFPVAAQNLYTYAVQDDGILIKGFYSDAKEITVPSAIDGLPVTALRGDAFVNCPNVTAITVPASVVSLPDGVFPAKEDLTVSGPADSAVAAYCAAHGIAFTVMEEKAAEAQAVVAGTSFSDVKTGDWFYAYIEDLVSKDIVHGRTPTTFVPNGTVTRAEFVRLLANLSGLSQEDAEAYRGKNLFTDVAAASWYAPTVNWAGELGIVDGVGENRFAPNNNVSRQEMMTMLYRYNQIVSKAALPRLVSELRFADSGSISSWAAEAVREMQLANIVDGKGNYVLDPLGNASRAEAAKIISVFSGLLDGSKDAQAIKGLVFADREKLYWQDGLRATADPAPEIRDNIMYVPGVIFGSTLGHSCTLSNASLTIQSADGATSLTVTDGSTQATDGGGNGVELGIAPYLSENGTLMIPIKVVAQYFGDVVLWDGANRAILLHAAGVEVADPSLWLKGLVWERGLRELESQKLRVVQETYGSSGQGQELVYTSIYRPGYTKTVFLVFEQHGFEDSYARDGQVLVNTANNLIQRYSKESAYLGNCRLVIVSSANPDGLKNGYTNNGPGRCTVVGKVDMNRDWPTSNYTPSTQARYYTLAPLSCNETRNLHNLIQSTNPSVLIDFHGWLNGTYGDSRLAAIFNSHMGLPYKTIFSQTQGLEANNTTYLSDDEVATAIESGLVGFAGYLAGWGKEQGYRSALVEFSSPSGVNLDRLNAAVDEVIRSAQ